MQHSHLIFSINFYLLCNYTLFIYTDILHLDLGWLYIICMYYQEKPRKNIGNLFDHVINSHKETENILGYNKSELHV